VLARALVLLVSVDIIHLLVLPVVIRLAQPVHTRALVLLLVLIVMLGITRWLLLLLAPFVQLDIILVLVLLLAQNAMLVTMPLAPPIQPALLVRWVSTLARPVLLHVRLVMLVLMLN
jgi:hypothetical protein